MKKSIFIIVIAASVASYSYCSAVCSPAGTSHAASHGTQSGSASIILLGLAAIDLGACAAELPEPAMVEAAAATRETSTPCREQSAATEAPVLAKPVADAVPALAAEKSLCDISNLARKSSGYKMAADTASLAK